MSDEQKAPESSPEEKDKKIEELKQKVAAQLGVRLSPPPKPNAKGFMAGKGGFSHRVKAQGYKHVYMRHPFQKGAK